jgi:hypothetical protein
MNEEIFPHSLPGVLLSVSFLFIGNDFFQNKKLSLIVNNNSLYIEQKKTYHVFIRC